jgi:protein SCO1/2
MRNRQRLAVIIVLLLSTMLSMASHADDPPQVVASIKPLHSLLAGLMAGVSEPRLLIDDGTPPWEFQPDANQMQAIGTADLVAWTGEELEPGLAASLSTPSSSQRVVEVLGVEALKVLPARDDIDRRDPFFWLDSRNMLILLDVFVERLAQLDPDRAPVYWRNGERVAEQLSRLDRAMEFGYRDVSGAPVFFYHDTHRYFEQAYAMNVAGSVVQVDGGEQADASRLLLTRSAVDSMGASCLFVEQGLQQPHADLLQQGGDLRRVELDSFGVGFQAGPNLYVEMMRANFDAIADCVRHLKPEAMAGDSFLVPDPSRSPHQLRPRYAMLDQHGRSTTHEDFAGRFQLIYFGYTSCPDICPTSLAVMAQALKRLDPTEAEQFQPIFITIDPERDTPDLLAEYVKYFHPRMLGLHASPEVTRRTAELFRAGYERVPSQSGDPDRYTMDHTASLFLLGPDGEFITKFAHGLPIDEVVQRLRGYAQQLAPQLSQRTN